MPAAVKSVTIARDRAWRRGTRRRQYVVVYTDDAGRDITVIERPIIVIAAAFNAATWAQNKLAKLAEREAASFYKDISKGVAVDFTNPKWQTRADLFRTVAVDVFKSGKESQVAINFIPYMDQATDNQLKSIFGKDDLWVTNVRAKVTKLKSIKTALDDYTPEDIS